MILIIISIIEIIGFVILKSLPNQTESNTTLPFYSNSVNLANENNNSNVNSNTNTNNITVNLGYEEKEQPSPENEEKRKALIRILFVDDKHKDFRMVSILKKSGWTNTKSVKDITDLDDPKVLEADIIFVDINGVGTTLFEDQGLGLASALKKKYNKKKIFIYSADTNGDRFHRALREVDGCLSKNAEPYQFINLIQENI
ncbi:response regulator [Flavobacterium stagni]|uniref:Response regulator n=1 Tax=Flavobacterium stagni TaxID=2506421 RepID=A0A4Q1KCX5_9FLAO|nr:response regulator [Flavobacterium stagni]